MAAQLKDTGRAPGVQFVRPKAFVQVANACKNPPKASAELKALIARGREMRKA